MQTHNLGIIGYGSMATWHHRNLLERAPEVVPYGAYDIDSERNEAAKEAGLKVYESAEALLADPAIDLVLVATTNNFHGSYAKQVMRAGKPVILEKPATITSQEFLEVMEVQKETGMHLSVHQNRRWDGDYLTVRQSIRDGLIGRPYLIKSRVHGSRGIPEGWRTHVETGGGMMLDWGVHLIDQVIQMVPEPLTHVRAHMQHTAFSQVDDGFTLELIFHSGLTAHIEVDTCCFVGEDRWHVRGDQGTIQVKSWDIDGGIVRAKDKHTDWEEEILYTSAGPTKTMAPRTRFSEERLELNPVEQDWLSFYHNFAAVIEGREQLIVKPEHVLFVIRVMEAAFESSDHRSVVPISFTLDNPSAGM